MAQEVTTAGRLMFALPFNVDPVQFSMHAWVNTVTTGGSAVINPVRGSDADKNHIRSLGNTTSGYRRSNPSTWGSRDVSGLTSTIDRWVAVGADSRNTDSEIWTEGTQVTGVSSGNNNIGGAGNAVNEFLVSADCFGSAYTNYSQARYAWVALWLGISLLDDEWRALNKGVNPRKIRPQSQHFYAPFIRDTSSKFRYAIAPTTSGGAFSAVPGPRQYGGI
jgi:hypothetical protein